MRPSSWRPIVEKDERRIERRVDLVKRAYEVKRPGESIWAAVARLDPDSLQNRVKQRGETRRERQAAERARFEGESRSPAVLRAVIGDQEGDSRVRLLSKKEQRLIRKRALGRIRRAKRGIPVCGSPEHRAKLAANTRAQHADPVRREKWRSAVSVALARPEVREKLKRPRSGHFKSEEFRERCRERWRDPAYRERVIGSLKQTLATKHATHEPPVPA